MKAILINHQFCIVAFHDSWELIKYSNIYYYHSEKDSLSHYCPRKKTMKQKYLYILVVFIISALEFMLIKKKTHSTRLE